jgi:3-hydroxyisobutyrate dehydrogenase
MTVPGPHPSEAGAAEVEERMGSPVRHGDAHAALGGGSLRVGVIGLGSMGLPMSTRLSGAHEVRGFDPSGARAVLAAEQGLKVVESATAAAQQADVVVLAVRDFPQVEEVLSGAGGVAGTLAPGAVVVLTSTVGTVGAQRAAEVLAGRSVHLVDFPVSGGPARAASGNLVGFAAGAPEVVRRVSPVLDLLASKVVMVGPRPGDGQAMKTVNQLLCGVHIAAAAEALSLAAGLGLDPRAVLDALSEGAAASFMLADRGPRIIEAINGGEPDVLSAVAIFEKDMGIVGRAGHLAGVALPVTSAAEQLYRLGAVAGLSTADDSVIVRLLLREGALPGPPAGGDEG